MNKNISYPQIMAEMYRHTWAITPEALEGIISVIDRDSVDRSLFHQAEPSALTTAADPVEKSKYSYVYGSTGLMYIDGPIIPRGDMFSEISGITTIEGLLHDLEVLNNDPEVENILLMLDTPGGSTTGISEFTQKIKNNNKPVDAFIYGMAASAGYWIASGARKIYSVDTGLAGSIGTVFSITDRSEQDKARGIKRYQIVSSQSPYKRPDMETEEGRTAVQTVADDLTVVFIRTVAENRGVSEETVLNDFGQGGIMVAEKALKNKMIDKITTLDNIINETKKPEKRGFTMGDTENQVTLESIKADHPAIVAQIESAAAETERTRIKNIEGLASMVADSPEAVKNAAQSAINAAKYDPKATADNTAVKVLEEIGKVKAETPTNVPAAGSSAEVLAAANQAPEGEEDPEQAAEAAIVKNMVAAANK